MDHTSIRDLGGVANRAEDDVHVNTQQLTGKLLDTVLQVLQKACILYTLHIKTIVPDCFIAFDKHYLYSNLDSYLQA